MMAPAITSALSVTMLTTAACPAKTLYAMQPTKKGMPPQIMKFGVADATPFHPMRSNSSGEVSMSVPVTMPVHMAVSPRKAL